MTKPSCCPNLQALISPPLFRAFADPSRIALLTQLAEAGEPRTVSQMAEGSTVDISVVSRHLAILRDAEILRAEKHGRTVYYTVRRDVVVDALRNLADALEACCAPVETAGA